MINNKSQSWQKALLPLGSTIQQAIRSLEISSMQIILIISSDGVLVGTLTDGDIRRAFLKGLTLDSGIEDIVHYNPLVVPPEIGRENVLQLMQANKVHQLPVVNCYGRVEGLYLLDAFITPSSIDNLMVIMAGGRGTRLQPHTDNCPKPMIEVGGKPILEHIIEHAKSEGFQNFIVSLHYLGEMIIEYFGDGTKWGIKIEYLHEDSPLGTAGCLSLISDHPLKPFIVTNGDVLTEIGYRDILDYHVKNEAFATMAVRRHEIQNPFGVVKVNGIEIEEFEEKPVYHSQVNAGIYAIDPGALGFLEAGLKCDMPTLFERVKNRGHKAIVFPMHESWLDVGRPQDLAQANRNDCLRREGT